MNPYRRAELPLYLRFALSTGQLPRAAARFAYVLLRREPAAGETPYPFPLPAVLSEPTLPSVDTRLFSGMKPLRTASFDVPDSWEVSLAGRKVRLDRMQDWGLSFPDPEDVYALHRFGWVLPALMEDQTSAPAIFFGRLVQDWIARVTPESHPAAWETYNTAERIANWIYLWGFLDGAGEKMPAEELARQSLHRQAARVAGRLEYFGDGASARTNNHMLDDARALYLAGTFLRVPSLQEAGRRVLLKECARSFTPGGFLREGSSHYQLLVLSRMLEVWIAADRAGDRSFADKVKPFVEKIFAAARFFSDAPDAALPLIGDVSPDFTPGWLRDVVFWNEAAEGSGWLGLWPRREKLTVPSPEEKGFRNFLSEGWCRYDGHGARVFWHVQPAGRIPNYSHAHHDAGSFELHWRGAPLIVDTGRAEYTSGPFGLYGRSARAHNACIVDGREPFVSDWLNGGRALLPDYKKARVESSLRADEQSLAVTHDGFSRLPGVGMYGRKFHFAGGEMAVEDRFEGSGAHRVDTYFHLAPEVEVRTRDGVVEFALPGRPGRAVLAAESAAAFETGVFRGEKDVEGSPLGWYCPRYGERVPAATVRFRQKTGFPLRNRFTLRWD